MNASSTSYTVDLDELAVCLKQYRRWFVLSGAGVSVDSGIPGYRDVDGEWKSVPPVYLQEFLATESRRQRYWARSIVGWPLLAHALPNASHRALARMQMMGRIERMVTQNVDGLHQRAGSTSVIELHGNVGSVKCMACNTSYPRQLIQQQIERENPAFVRTSAMGLPDGDADVAPGDISQFRVPACAHCGGILKPSVVFFGEGVPRDRVDDARQSLERADAMLVVGSSLMVYSGYRFCEWADKLGKPMVAINLGRTRADHLFAMKIEAACGAVLASLVESLSGDTPPRHADSG